MAASVSEYEGKLAYASIFERCGARGVVYRGIFYEFHPELSVKNLSFGLRALDRESIHKIEELPNPLDLEAKAAEAFMEGKFEVSVALSIAVEK